ncbi:hypothetical protein, partial [Segetibacter sp.]|uniref:hypothetical protein n=1 Tax=Segetibacter sp. TaxID=2231182 RepID=UPI0026040F7C
NFKLNNTANEVANNTSLGKRSRLFSNQLFDGCNSLYASYCLRKYIRTDNCTNGILLLFFATENKGMQRAAL